MHSCSATVVEARSRSRAKLAWWKPRIAPDRLLASTTHAAHGCMGAVARQGLLRHEHMRWIQPVAKEHVGVVKAIISRQCGVYAAHTFPPHQDHLGSLDAPSSPPVTGHETHHGK